MPEEPTTSVPSQPEAISQQPSATPSPIDAAEYEALLQENAQWRATFASLEPQADRIKRLRDDPNAAQLFDNAVSAYEEIERKRGPKVSEELSPIYDKVSKLEGFVDEYRAQQKNEAERPQREFMSRYTDWQNSAANNRFFSRLMADHPELKQRDIQYLAQVASEQNFEPLEETWKRESWRFLKPGEATPPSSLRTDVGEVGIPGESQKGASDQGPSMRQRIVELERARRGIA